MIYQGSHRVIGELNKKLRHGKNLVFLTGEAIRGNDCFFYSLEKGLQDLASTLMLYYLSPEGGFDYFLHIHISLDHILYYKKTPQDIVKIGEEEFLAPLKMEGPLNLNANQADSGAQAQNAQGGANAAGNPEAATQQRLLEALAEKSHSRIMIFFDNLHWIARLHENPPATSVLSFLLNDCSRLRNVVSVVSIQDMRLLENFNVGCDEIYVGKPAPREIHHAFLRYLLRNAQRLDFDLDALDQLAHSMGAGKKKLNDCMRILANVLKHKPASLNLKDFEDSFEKGIEEKIAWKDVRLPQKTREEIERVVDEFLRDARGGGSGAARKGILVWGPPGTGKTMIAKALANEKKCHFMNPSLADLKGEYVGQSSAKIKAIFAEARANQPTILFIDEADTVFPAREGNVQTDSFNMDMVNQFLQETDGARSGGQRIFIVAATNREHAIDNAIKSRLGRPIEIGLPDRQTRLLIMDDNIRRMQKEPPFTLQRASFQGEVLAKLDRMSGRDLENFIKTLFSLRKAPLADDEKTRELFFESLAREEEDVFGRLKREVFTCGEVLDPDEAAKQARNIIGLSAAKEALERQIEFIKSSEEIKNRYSELRVEIPNGVLLYGPPGNGKSELVKYMAGKHGFYFFKVSSKDFVETYPKAQIERLEKIFYETTRFSRMMRACGILLFFDEFDSLALKGALDHAVRGALLNCLTDRKGIRDPTSKIMFVAATNYEDRIDDAVKRPGRIDAAVEIFNPAEAEGIEILEQKALEESATLQVAKSELARAWKSLRKKKHARILTDLLDKNALANLENLHDHELNPSGAELEQLFNDLKYAAFKKGSVAQNKLVINADIVRMCFPGITV